MTATNINTWWGAVLLLIMVAFCPLASAQERKERNKDIPSIVVNVPQEDVSYVIGGGGFAFTTVTHGEEPSTSGGGGYGELKTYIRLGNAFRTRFDFVAGVETSQSLWKQTSDQRNRGTASQYKGSFGIRLMDLDGYEDGEDEDAPTFTLEANLSLGYYRDRSRNHSGESYSGRHEAFFGAAKGRLELHFPLLGTGFGVDKDIWSKWPGADYPSRIFAGFLPKIDIRGEFRLDLSVHRHTTPRTRQKNKWLMIQPRVHLWRFVSAPDDMLRDSMHWLDIFVITQLQGEIAYGFLNDKTREGHWTYRLGIGGGLEYTLFVGSERGMNSFNFYVSAIYSEAQNGRHSEDVVIEAGVSLSGALSWLFKSDKNSEDD